MSSLTVLGVWPNVRPEVTSVFVRISAMVSEGILEPVDSPESNFPTRGEIHVFRDRVPQGMQHQDIAMFEADVSHLYEENPNQYSAKYTATRHLTRCPAEIIPCSFSSSSINEIRDLLLSQGVSPPHSIRKHPVLFEFQDGIVSGPFHLDLIQNLGRYSCSESALDEPVSAWESREKLEPVELRCENSRRLFVSHLELPNPDFYLDLTTVDQALSSMLRIGCKEGPGTYLLTRRKRDEIVARLSSVSFPDRLASRRARLEKLLTESLKTGEDLGRWTETFLQHPASQNEIAVYKSRCKEEAHQELLKEKSELLKELSNLRKEVGGLETQKSDLESQIESKPLEIEAAIIDRAEKAQDKVDRILSQVSILKPFLNTSVETERDSIHNQEIPQKSLSSIEDILDLLTLNLKKTGLISGGAKTLSMEILSALLMGQWILFQGSMKNVLADMVGRTLTCENRIQIQIPPGLTSSAEFEKMLLAHKTDFTSITLEGVNSSCFETYGASLERVLAKRTLEQPRSFPFPCFLGTILDGPGAIPIDPLLTATGLVVHTDCLSWKTSEVEGPIPGQISDFEISSERDVVEGVEELNEMLKLFETQPSILWRKNVHNIFRFISSYMPEEELQTYMVSIMFGWILPRFFACRLNEDALMETIKKIGMGDIYTDSRIQAYLKLAGINTNESDT